MISINQFVLDKKILVVIVIKNIKMPINMTHNNILMFINYNRKLTPIVINHYNIIYIKPLVII